MLVNLVGHVHLQGAKDHTLLSMDTLLATPLGSPQDPLPTRRVDIDLTPVSLVLGTPLTCYPNSPLEFQLLNGKKARAHPTMGARQGGFQGDVVAAVQPNIQAELKDAKVTFSTALRGSAPPSSNAATSACVSALDCFIWRDCLVATVDRHPDISVFQPVVIGGFVTL